MPISKFAPSVSRSPLSQCGNRDEVNRGAEESYQNNYKKDIFYSFNFSCSLYLDFSKLTIKVYRDYYVALVR